MGGGRIVCGDYTGEDKSGSAISGLLEALQEFLSCGSYPRQIKSTVDEIAARLQRAGDHILIESELAINLKAALVAWHAEQQARNGFQDQWEAVLSDDSTGLDPVDAKWGKGPGWRYHCACDMIKACTISQATGEPICIAFW